VQEIVHERITFSFRHGVPIQFACKGESAHILFAFAGCRLPPLVAFGGEVGEDALLGLWRQLFHQLHHLLVG